jgi:nucleoside-diphosphate kinase
MQSETESKNEIALVILKPDCIAKSLADDIFSKFQINDLKCIKDKVYDKAPKDFLEEHYGMYKTRPTFNENIEFMMSGPIIVRLYEGPNAVFIALKLKSEIRTQYNAELIRNLIHVSDSEEDARRESAIWLN